MCRAARHDLYVGPLSAGACAAQFRLVTKLDAAIESGWDTDRLDVLLPMIWHSLQTACRDRGSAFRNVVVATTGADGRPHARIVVLRAADGETGTIEFHTDARSAKVGQLMLSGVVELLFWDPASSVQIRISGVAMLHEPGSDEAARALAPIPDAGRAKYRTDPAPGTVIASPGSLDQASETAVAERFTLVQVRAQAIDFLRLVGGDQRRAMFDLRAGFMSAAWISP